MALSFPNPATQTPLNTYSPTSTPAATTNGVTYTWDGTLGAWKAAAGGGGSTLAAATAAEAAAGTLTTVYSSPATAVPKSGANMTGAALIPGGNDGARPGTPVTGMLRYNNQAGLPAVLEFYDGTGWVTAYTGGAPLNNVIYGTGTIPVSSTLTITHTSVNLAKSYIILNYGSGFTNAGATVSARTSTSFNVVGNSSMPISYFLVY